MDTSILRNIVASSTVSLSAETAKEWQAARDSGEFPATRPVLVDGLAKSLARLLTYKVSPEAYQRYSVRLHVIVNSMSFSHKQETVRDWSRLEGDLGELPLFQDNERSHQFLLHLLNKHLTDKLVNGCDNVDYLVQLAGILLGSQVKNATSKKYFAKVVDRILSLSQSERSETFLQYILEKNDELCLESCLVERIYVAQKSLFIEKPLDKCFSEFCLDQGKEENFNRINFIFEKVVDSPSLFHSISDHLKNLFVMTKYSEKSISFIKKVLVKIQMHCDKYNKDSIDLYPASLQFSVILLRIEPTCHTEKSKNHTIQSLKQIFLEDINDALILVSHFPEWLDDYLKFFEILQVSSQSSETQSTVEFDPNEL